METTYPNMNEINPQEYFSTMKQDFYKVNSSQNQSINKLYLKKRKDLINFNHKLTKKLGFKSQTFFLSIYYLDIIFQRNKNFSPKNFFLLGLSCFIIASKYSENDPNVPPLQSFINLYNKYNIHHINMKELKEMEIEVLKLLEYKIHYVTAYDFNFFFFNHGIIKKQQIKDIINNNTNYNEINNNLNSNKSDIDLSNNEELDFVFDDSFYIKKILEKIYKKSRYYLDSITLNENINFKYDSLIISICIMKKSVEETILKEYKIKFKDYFLNKRQIIKKNNLYFKEIMNDFYKINYELDEKYDEIMKDVDIINIFNNRDKKKIEIKNNNKDNYKENINNFIKVNNTKKLINNDINTSNGIDTNTYNNINNINNNIINDSVVIKNASREQSKEKENNPKHNLTLFQNYNQKYNRNRNTYNNNINNNNNRDIENAQTINSNSYIENLRNKYTFSQLKNKLKKDFSLKKKRCSDRYSHINNLKSLYKLSSLSTAIQNIKAGSLSKEKNYENFNNMTYNNNINNSLYYVNDTTNNNNKYYSKDKDTQMHNNIINKLENNNKIEIQNNNSNNNKIEIQNNNSNNNKINRYNKVIITDNFYGKEKNNTENSVKNITEANTNYNINNKMNSNRKPYYKKVIHNYDTINKKIINKNNIKINIFNILNTSNNLKEYEPKNNFITLNTDNNLIKKRMIEINKINKLKYLYNKTIDNININKSPKSNSKSKELNYINIINDTNDTNNINNIDNANINQKYITIDNKSSYFKKKIFKSMNKNKNNIFKKFDIKSKSKNVNSGRESYKFSNNNKLLLTNIKINDNNDDYFKRKFDLNNHNKLFYILTKNK